MASDRVVLKLDDLVSWITEEVEWNHGIIAPCINNKAKKADPVKKEEATEENHDEAEKSDAPSTENSDSEGKKALVVKEESNQDVENNNKETKVLVLSYQTYCRYRSMLKRLEGSDTEEWLQNSIVIALGGFAASNPNTRVLFCRDNFEHDELAHHELNCEYLAPTIKGKRKKRKTKNARSTSPESNTSEECKEIEVKNNQKTNGLKQPPIKNEQEFLQRLFKFMKKRNTPIHRVPHLGFKQIDLYVFYSFAQKLGGYDKITGKKLWKHVYDELGGNPGSTSAATCTRRHYERLLLPFERHMEGIVYKPAQRGKKSQKKQEMEEDKECEENNTAVKTEPVAAGNNAEVEDAYTFTDSNHENSNSKDSNSNEFNSVCDEQALVNEPSFSDEDSKTVWSIQKQPDNKDEADKDDSKPIKPLIIQKGQSETFAEKERKWDEIRRKNAAARKWVRQSRSTRGCKTPIPEIPPFNQDKCINLESESAETNAVPQPDKVKSETVETISNQNVPALPSQNKLISDSKVNTVNHCISKFLPPGTASDVHNSINKLENHTINKLENHTVNKLENHTQKRLHTVPKESQVSIPVEKKVLPAFVKTEPIENNAKSWCGYPGNSEYPSYQSSLYCGSDNYAPGFLKNQMPSSYKAGTRSEPDVARDYLMHTGRQSVGSMSVSSAVSLEAPTGEEKPLVPQRRPSVIQHTEYAATSPSPSISPKQTVDTCRNISPKEGASSVPFSSSKLSIPSQPGYSVTGKVAEWLTKGVHEVVACKTPSTAVEKTVELHDKVMVPSICKTPGAIGTSKVPINNVKSKHNACVLNCPKSPRSKYASSHRHRNSDTIANGNYNSVPRNDVRNNALYQKPFHTATVTHSSVMANASVAPKYQQTINQSIKPEYYSNGPYFNQPKRFKNSNNLLPSMLPAVNPRPSLLPFIRQQTYRTSPLSDIPKTTASTHNDYETVVLDLSVKKKPPQVAPSRTTAPIITVSTSPVPEEGVCLDLSIKKKSNVSNDNGIENITPPLPLSPNPSSQVAPPYMHSSLKPIPTLIALQDLAAEEAARHSYSSSNSRIPPIMTSSVTPPVSGPPLVMPPTNAMFPASTHSKIPPGFVNSMPPVAYSKDIAKNLYMPSTTRHSQFTPYVIPPFFQSNWTSVVNSTAVNAKQTNNSQTSPMAYKGMVNHSVFPKDYPYNVKSQFHNVLCKDNGHYPSNGK
ncbi:AT-rich interactive domain-containing protein 5B, partial [Stegodyphus mimosarum]